MTSHEGEGFPSPSFTVAAVDVYRALRRREQAVIGAISLMIAGAAIGRLLPAREGSLCSR